MPSARVLSIEDDELAAMMLRYALRRQGTKTFLRAPDAESGLSLARRYQPDVIFLDVYLPAQDGIQALQALRDDWRTRHIPVALVTADISPKTYRRGQQAGADAYLLKPFSLLALERTLVTLTAPAWQQPDQLAQAVYA